MATKTSNNGASQLHGSNDAEELIGASNPYVVRVTIEGTADLLCHRYSPDSVAEKAASKKGSAAKKTDDLESYVYRNPEGKVCLPGMYLRGAIVGASKFRQDPRSPRKSAMDLFKAGVVATTHLAPIVSVSGKEQSGDGWDYVDQQGVQVNRARITRCRPAFFAGWTCEIDLAVLVPEYITAAELLSVITDAGRLVGVGDFRPTYGRFQVVKFEKI